MWDVATGCCVRSLEGHTDGVNSVALSADGQDVYISFNGPTNGDVYVAVSHDAGATWSQVQVTDGDRYYFAYQGFVAPDGRVTFAEMSETYTGHGGASEGPVHGQWIITELRRHGYEISPGTLYPLLERMRRHGWLRN